MPVEEFIRYQGKCYGPGTVVRYRTTKWSSPMVGRIVSVDAYTFWIRYDDNRGGFVRISKTSIDFAILEIIEPVEIEPPPVVPVSNRNYPSYDDEFYGWIWYIAIMLLGTIFNARIGIWIIATIVFFAWKNGFLRSNKN